MDEPKKKPPPPPSIPDNILVPSDADTPNGHAAPAVSYTSLRDLIPAVAPPSIMSPTHNASWHEIPIRNPLVKQAALSYLQPMSAPPEAGERGIFGNMRDLFCGCFSWLSDAVSRRVNWVLGGEDRDRVRGWIDEDDDFDEDDEEDDGGREEKVD